MRNREIGTVDDLWLDGQPPPVVYIPGRGYIDERFVDVADAIDAIDVYLALEAQERARYPL